MASSTARAASHVAAPAIRPRIVVTPSSSARSMLRLPGLRRCAAATARCRSAASKASAAAVWLSQDPLQRLVHRPKPDQASAGVRQRRPAEVRLPGQFVRALGCNSKRPPRVQLCFVETQCRGSRIGHHRGLLMLARSHWGPPRSRLAGSTKFGSAHGNNRAPRFGSVTRNRCRDRAPNSRRPRHHAASRSPLLRS